MGIQKDQVISVSSEVLFQEVSGEMVLLDLASENYFGLDELGARIWGLLNEGKDVSQILELLLQEYEVDRKTLEEDVEELLGNLLEAGLIKM
jgi:hypothetical protein